MKIVDLFCGIGAFRLGFENCNCVFSIDNDKYACKVYKDNFGEDPMGDITKISTVPDHDILLAGFPCQPFSQAGLELGFEDTRGTLIYDVIRIIKDKRPRAFVLENVKGLTTHDKGRTLKVILKLLRDLNYYVPEPKVLSALDFGVPQNRERVFIVGFLNKVNFTYPVGDRSKLAKLSDYLDTEADTTLSDRGWAGYQKRDQADKKHKFTYKMLDENSIYCPTLLKGCDHILVKQEGKNPRTLTTAERARLQGLPSNFKLDVPKTRAKELLGNTICVPVVKALAAEVLKCVD